MQPGTVRLLISCPDARGIVAAVAGFIESQQGNILDADQHTDPDQRLFFMRLAIEQEGFALRKDSFAAAWQPVADRFAMRWRVHWSTDRKRLAIFVSQESHCLNDLLWRWRTGELRIDLPLVIGDHADLEQAVTACGVAFHHLPVTTETRREQEERIETLLTDQRIDLIVLARYMRILSPAFVARYSERIINIHHSFLPAFVGPRPYHRAYERGVKIIGATSHYVTAELDAGPIIAQDTLPIGHRDTVEDLIRKGRDLERLVLARAVRYHVEDKVFTSGNRTIVFE